MLLTVGRIVRPHGVRGELLVELATDDPGQRFAAGTTLLAEPPAGAAGRGAAAAVPAQLTIETARPHQGRLLVVFAGVADRAAADQLRGVLLRVDSAEIAAPADPDEFHDHQLVGLTVVDPAGDRLGTVARIDHAPAADLLVLERPGGGSALVPFVKAIVPRVDLASGQVVVDPPAGLLDL